VHHTPLKLSKKNGTPSFEDRLGAYAREARTAAETTSPAASIGKLCACSMAAGAVLGLSQPAFSAIVYSGSRNIPVVGTVYGFWGIANSYFLLRGVGFISNAVAYIFIPAQQNIIANFSNEADNLSTPFVISPAANWKESVGFRLQYGGYLGNFINERGYIGVRISAGGGNWHYGWIQFDGTYDGVSGGRIIDWAYEDCVNVGIRAGATQNSRCGPYPVPTLSEWGMIILIALLAGCGMHRIRKQRDEDDHLAGA